MRLKKEAEVEQCRIDAREWVGDVSDRDLTIFALALYAGEGSKADGSVVFANSDPVLMNLFVTWLRRHFDLDESRFRIKMRPCERTATSMGVPRSSITVDTSIEVLWP